MVQAAMTEGQVFLSALAMVLATGLIGSTVAVLAKNRSRSLSLLDQALRSNVLDAQTKQMITRSLIRRPLLSRLWAGGKLLMAIGWVMMFLGAGFLISGENDLVDAAFPLGLAGFALVSLPFALRELDNRRHAHE